MTDASQKSSVKRVTELGGRNATVLEHGSLRVMVDDMGGMIPELSLARGKRRLNAHWLPWFRSGSGRPWKEEEDAKFWKGRLLYNLAGSFPCIPNFGGDNRVDGVDLPPHGWTAQLPWQFRSSGADKESGALWALSVLESPEKAMPLSFRKIDALIPGQNIHYMSIASKTTATPISRFARGGTIPWGLLSSRKAAASRAPPQPGPPLPWAANLTPPPGWSRPRNFPPCPKLPSQPAAKRTSAACPAP